MVLAAVGQICSTASMSHNLAQCRTVIQKAVAAGAKTLFLPEASDYIGSSPDESRSLCKPVSSSPFVLGLQDEARRHRLPINVGIHEPSNDPKKLRNTLVHISEEGKITQRYQKLHLFDLDLSDSGGPKMKESDTTEAGSSIIPPFDSPVGKIGMAICFDLRFPELSLALKRQGADMIIYPSAFTPPTGKVHWHALLRARAIETQSYILAAAQVGAHNEKRTSYGHSIIISPWGEVIAELPGPEDKEQRGDSWEPEIIVADIDHELLAKIHREMPLIRRTDVYPEV
ncbi:carbon-nitrogen hydrolase-like protein 3 [Elsinoe australis]|uniref:Carbon-nitrogen hydrolase-like protein 3 n=1 Tax=Elsinoe australis TaxID=40998 RepID=A0A4U7AZ02_9PEZI|nr:carbon-nitrogen hydrolase-like protein 3 [Elsinoe australis]